MIQALANNTGVEMPVGIHPADHNTSQKVPSPSWNYHS
jgi:hypothetical protein